MTSWLEKQEDVEYQAEEVQKKADKLNKKYYKYFLIAIKYLPIFDLILEILYSITAYLGYDGIIFTFIGGFSLSGLCILYMASYVFKYCYLYRISLHTITLVNILALYDSFIRIPLSDLNMLRLYLIILIIGVISFILFKYKDHKKQNI